MVGLFHEDFSTTTLTPEPSKKINAVPRKPVGDAANGPTGHPGLGSCEPALQPENAPNDQTEITTDAYCAYTTSFYEYASYEQHTVDDACAENLLHNIQPSAMPSTYKAAQLEPAAVITELHEPHEPHELHESHEPLSLRHQPLPHQPQSQEDEKLPLMDTAGKDLAPALALAAIAEPICRGQQAPSHYSIASLVSADIPVDSDQNPNPHAPDESGHTSRQQSPIGAQSPIRRRPVGAGDSRSDSTNTCSPAETPLVSVLEHADLTEPSRVRRVPVPNLDPPKLPTPPQQPFECSF